MDRDLHRDMKKAHQVWTFNNFLSVKKIDCESSAEAHRDAIMNFFSKSEFSFLSSFISIFRDARSLMLRLLGGIIHGTKLQKFRQKAYCKTGK
jgi:hypothetical protein